MNKTRNQAQQTQLFQQGEDLPLFSGAAPRAEIEPFKPRLYARQLSLFNLHEGTATNEAK